MAKYQFSVNENQELIDLAYGKRVIGKLKVITPPYLYEWASQEYHKGWVANGGISPKEMNDILRSTAQAGGRGYYVSTNPINSSTFGDALTVFKANGPLLTIEATSSVVGSAREFMFARLCVS